MIAFRSSTLALYAGAVFALGACADASAVDDGPDPSLAARVEVCHVSIDDPTAAATMAVDPTTVQAHLDRGDRLGACDDDILARKRDDDGGS